MGGPVELIDKAVVGGCLVVVYDFVSGFGRVEGKSLRQRRIVIHNPEGQQMGSLIARSWWVDASGETQSPREDT